MQNLELKHLDQTSLDGTQLTIDALARIAPSCITEVKDSKTGSIKHAVDFHVLRQLLGDAAVEDAPEAYEFTWVGKQKARREAAQSINKTLRPVPEDSVDWDNTQNLYIEGDNLEALKLLQKSYLGKVKMIYIDPPYNTGNDFVYHDDFKVGQNEYDKKAGNVDEEGNRLVSRNDNDLDEVFLKNTDSNGRFHSDWCSMIYSRLMIARSLLTEDGVIFISIDDNEVENLKKILNEICGENNFEGHIHWRRRHNQPNDKTKMIGLVAEHILAYAKNSTYLKAVGVGKLDLTANFTNPDNDPKGPWASKPWKVGSDQSGSSYTIVTPSGKFLEGEWMGEENTYKEFLKEGRIYFPKGGDGMPRKKYYKFERQEEGQCATNWWPHELFGHNQGANDLATSLFGVKNIFSNPKPIELLRGLLKIGNVKQNDIILDFFSGSATTAHAVMQLNAEDGGNRRFIMVQLPEETAEDSEAYKAGYKNICEIGKERIRRAGAKIKDELESKKQKENGGKESVSEGNVFENSNNNDSSNNNSADAKGSANNTNASTSLDTGFRVFRIDSGNMKEDLEQAPSEVDQLKLDLWIDNVKDDRTELDLLFGCMLNWGVQLSLPMSMETVDGCNIYTVNEGDLVACLTKDKPVTENIVRAIAEKSPLRVLFRDGSFASDAAKINIFEQFKQLMDWSDEEIVKNVRVL